MAREARAVRVAPAAVCPVAASCPRAFVADMRHLLLSSILLGLAACQPAALHSDGAGSAASPQELQGRWSLRAFEGEPVEEAAGLFIDFSEPPQLTGHGGCNRFFGRYRYRDQVLEIRPALGSTKAACEPSVMVREERLFDRLPSAVSARLGEAGEVLTLIDGKGDPLLRARRQR